MKENNSMNFISCFRDGLQFPSDDTTWQALIFRGDVQIYFYFFFFFNEVSLLILQKCK